MRRIKINKLSVSFKRLDRTSPRFKIKKQYKFIEAIKNVSMEASDGDVLGVIGGNGSGKSTLLRAMAGVIRSDRVDYAEDSRVSSIMSLGMGYNSDLSGRDNSILHAMLDGSSYKEAKALLRKVKSFASISNYIDRPIKTYSLGMYQRLTFANIMSLKPNLVLIDEAFSVGDAHFRESVRTLIKSAESRKLLFVIASHDMSQLQEVCTHCLWLKQGELRYFGVAKSEIFERYLDETKEISEIRC